MNELALPVDLQTIIGTVNIDFSVKARRRVVHHLHLPAKY
jgi:hypothetical protein